jgi:hypothetical protein
MKRKLILVSAAGLLLAFSTAWAEVKADEESAESTIRVMGDAEATLPSAVTDEIALPESVPEDSAAHIHAQRGLDEANENRLRREAGLATAEEARERGASMAEDAMDNRETRGRSQDLPERPEIPDRGPPGT